MWKPPDQASWCQYALNWTEIKHSCECDQLPQIKVEAVDDPDTLGGGDETPPTDVNALAIWEDNGNGNGRITCAEARARGIAPVHRGHSAYELMRGADGDGVVCK